MNTLLIVNYNDYDSTSKLIDNVKDYKILDLVLVVDNKSTDGSYKRLKAFENKKIKVIETESNKGYGYAINYGAKYVIDNYKDSNLIVSNADIIIKDETDLKLLISDLDKYDVVAPTINTNGDISRGWMLPSPMLDIGLNLVYFHKLLEKKYMYYKDTHYKGDITRVDVVSGCFFLIKTSTLESIDYFDENIFLYYEENILSSKLNKKNIVIDNRVEIIHNHSVTIDKNIKKINKYKELKKSQRYFEKYYNNANIFELILLFLTNKISLIIYYIGYFIKDLFGKH
ncbi:MAG: glycosyltransferase family 2 protein [Bacilli bacterium]|nr:glycosyltransferase family 2 protein [Bacilli bacterium]